MSERKHNDFYQLKAQSFFENFAGRYLAYLGNMRPTKRQLSEMIELLSHVWLRHFITSDARLSEIESQCLYLFSQGKTAPQIAQILSISERQIKRYRENILRELDCNNITQAVVIGIRYGQIPPVPIK